LFIIQFLLEINERASQAVSAVFAKLYEEHLPRVFGYISYKVSDRNLAEDLTSTVFEKAITKYDGYKSEKAAFSTWVLTIARNTVIDHFRASSKKQNSPLEEASSVPIETPSTEDQLIKGEEALLLQASVARLSPKEQEIISLKFGAELTNREIARTTGLSESNVGIILFRTVRKLRSEFNA
jgi:RNA polymerase sigma factor (sigma-70 family)